MQCARHQRSRRAWRSGRVRRLARILGSSGSSGASARVFPRQRPGPTSDPGSHRRGNASTCGRCLPGDRPRGDCPALTRSTVGRAPGLFCCGAVRGPTSFDSERNPASRPSGACPKADQDAHRRGQKSERWPLARDPSGPLRSSAVTSIAAPVATTQHHRVRSKRKSKSSAAHAQSLLGAPRAVGSARPQAKTNARRSQ